MSSLLNSQKPNFLSFPKTPPTSPHREPQTEPQQLARAAIISPRTDPLRHRAATSGKIRCAPWQTSCRSPNGAQVATLGKFGNPEIFRFFWWVEGGAVWGTFRLPGSYNLRLPMCGCLGELLSFCITFVIASLR